MGEINEKIIIEQIIEDKEESLTQAEIELNKISNLTYAEVEAYVQTSMTNDPSGKQIVKLLSRILLALIKTFKLKVY